jgi:succinyl-diaminopimelate desuccinylase
VGNGSAAAGPFFYATARRLADATVRGRDGTTTGRGRREVRGFEGAIGFAGELIRIPSPPGAEERVARRVVAEMERLGFDEAWTDEVGNAVGVIRGRGEAAPVMLSSHLDVVDAGDPDGWEHPPYGGVVADGWLHGRGAMDIKGPLALQTWAAARFVEERPAGDLIVAHTVLEERGGWGMAHLLESGAVEPGAVVIGEATGGDICIGHRGRGELEIVIRGLAGHASAPDRARSALDGVAPILSALRALPSERLADEDPVLGRSTLVATDVVATPTSRNVIPDRAVIAVDWRVLPGRDAEASLALVRSFLAERVTLEEGLDYEVRFTAETQTTWTGRTATHEMFGPGFLLDADHPLVRAAAGAVADATGASPAVRPWRFATDGRHTAGVHGIPTLGYAPGEERHAHTNTERLSLAEARRVYDAYPALIRALFGAL